MSDKYAALRAAAEAVKETAHIARYTKAMVARQDFKEAATFDVILDLLAEREADKARIAELDDALCKLLPGCEYMDPPDGGSPSLITQVQRMVEDYRQRIADLESRKVKLPQRYSMLHRLDFDEPYHTEMVYKQSEVLEALAAAGITLETGE